MPLQFTTIEVVKTDKNFFYVEWDIVIAPPPTTTTTTTPGPPPPSESGDDYKYQIHWSRDPASGFIPVLDEHAQPVEIDGAVGPLAYEHQLRQYDFNQDSYYKILAINKANPLITILSSMVFVGMYSNGIHEVMRHAEDTLYTMYHGEPCFLIKRKSFGARCPTCWSVERQQRMRTHCDTCHGTGFVTGYYQPIDVQITFDADPKKSDLQKEYENVYDTKRARLSNYPLVRPKDLVVNKDDYKRYVVSHVETTKLPMMASDATHLSRQNYILSQLLVLEELNPDDNEYFLDINHIPEVPIGDEGQTGSTLPYFNDHKAVTVDAPLTVDTNQHVALSYNPDDFIITAGALALRTGSVENFIAGTDFTELYLAAYVKNDGTIGIANILTLNHAHRIVGITLNTASVGNPVSVRKIGRIVNPSWTWVIGDPIFFNTLGRLNQIRPLAGFGLRMGKPINPTTMEVEMGEPFVLA